jgi:hypothetical protein
MQKDANKSRKIRVIIVSEDLLSKIPSMETPQFECVSHATRWKLLNMMAKKFHNPDTIHYPSQITPVEFVVPDFRRPQ